MQKLITALALTITASPAFAIDFNTVDVAGVRIGMSPKEAIPALAKFCGVKPSTFSMKRFDKNVSNGGFSELLFCSRKDGTRLSVEFEASTLERDGPWSVQQILYTVPYTLVNLRKLVEAEDEKFGPPPQPNYRIWCNNPGPGYDPCANRKNEVTIQDHGDHFSVSNNSSRFDDLKQDEYKIDKPQF